MTLSPTPSDQLQRSLGLLESRQDTIHVSHLRPTAASDSFLSAASDYRRVEPFFHRHRAKNGESSLHLGLFLGVRSGPQLRCTRKTLEDLRHGAEFLHLLQLFEEVLEGEAVLADPPDQLLGPLLVHPLLGLLDQGHNVAHAEDPIGHPLRMERLDPVDLLAGPDVLEGPSGRVADR